MACITNTRYLFEHVYIEDFINYHEMWKYKNNDDNKEVLVGYSEQQNTYLIFDPKNRGTFTSAA